MTKVSEGIVIETKGKSALVRPLTCSISCGCHDDELGLPIIDANNEMNAAVGDKVVYEVPEEGMVLAAFIAFILPIILVFIGAAIGYNMAPVLSISPTIAAVIGGCLSFIIALVIIKIHDKSASKVIPVIVRISSRNYIALNTSKNGQKYYILDNEVIR
ncbi:MAG: SoxR reducing system RseC family protein [Syntrophomonas sp.]